MVLRGQGSVLVSNILRHSPVDGGPESEFGGNAMAANNLVVPGLVAPVGSVLVVGFLGEPGRVAAPEVVEPGFVVAGQAGILDHLRTLEEKPVLAILVDPADVDEMRDDPL